MALFLIALYAGLGMKEWSLQDQKDDGNILTRVMRITPTMNVPDIFKRVISDSTYVERDRFDRQKSAMEVVIEPQLMKNKFDMRAVYSVVPIGDARCKRIFEGDVKVSIMILGGQIEKYMVEQLKQSYTDATRITKQWIEKRKAAV